MKTACAQMKVRPGNVPANFRRMKEMIAEAGNAGADIVIFPEMCLGGYLLGDRWLDDGFCRDLMSYNEDLRALSGNILLVYGSVYLDENSVNRDGRSRKYNAVYAFKDGQPVPHSSQCAVPGGVTFKTLLPNYRIFDDERYFFSMCELAFDKGVPVETLLVPFRTNIGGEELLFGCEVCEDLWYNDYYYNGRPLNVSRILIENGAQKIFNLSASPWTWGKDGARDRRIADAVKDAGKFVPFYYVNCVGVQNNGKNLVTFDGDSAVYGSDGTLVCEVEAPNKEELLIHDDSSGGTASVRTLRSDLHHARAEAHFDAAVHGIRAVDDIVGFSEFPYIIGLSGGVDSAMVAVLTERAVGKDRVRLFNLPTRYNSDATKSAARHVAEKLDIPLTEIPIGDLVKANSILLDQFNPSPFNLENVQAKIRGTSVLSNIAGISGGMMTCNGNKVEIALGYATLYGDVNGILAPIGDLLKTEVFALARYVNTEVFGTDVIPPELLPDGAYNFVLPPTAELKASQRDPMKWGYHDALVREFTTYRRKSPEDIVEWYAEGKLAERLEIDPALIRIYGLDDPVVFISDLEWVVVSMQRAVFKRIQSPPIIIMSRGSYGYDIRESQLPPVFTRRYHELKKGVLTHHL